MEQIDSLDETICIVICPKIVTRHVVVFYCEFDEGLVYIQISIASTTRYHKDALSIGSEGCCVDGSNRSTVRASSCTAGFQ